MLIFERSKPEFLLVDDSSHVISECPRAPGNRAFLCHCGLQWRRTNRNHISIKCSRKLLFDSQIESPRSAFSARRPTTTLAWRLGTRVSSQPRKSRCSMSKPVNFPVNTCHNNSLKLVQENSGKPSESILIYLSPPPPHLEWLFVHSGRSNRAGKPPCWHHIYGLHCSDGFTRSKFPSEAKLYEHRIMTSAPAKSSRCDI